MKEKTRTRIADSVTKSSSPVSQGAFAAAMDRLIDLVVERFVVLEKRMAQVESKGLEYCGIHSRAVTYRKGSVVTRSGSLWISCKETSDTPGKSDAWQLISKGK